MKPVAYGFALSDFLRAYYLAADHPCKLRILEWIESMAGRNRIAVKTKSGFRLAVDRRDLIQNTVFVTRQWEPEIEDFLRANLTSEDVFFDIGANVGYFTLAALHGGCRKVVAFEPNPELQKVLLLNLRINDIEDESNILVGSALSDRAGIAIYQKGPLDNSGTGRILTSGLGSGQEIHTTTLDSYIVDSGNWPTILKIDVEGWELQVLQGGKNLFQNRPPRIIIFEADCDSNYAVSNLALLDFFESHSYEVSRLKRVIPEAKENYIAVLNS